MSLEAESSSRRHGSTSFFAKILFDEEPIFPCIAAFISSDIALVLVENPTPARRSRWAGAARALLTKLIQILRGGNPPAATSGCKEYRRVGLAYFDGKAKDPSRNAQLTQITLV
jgi:hypothetical protein